MDQRFYHLGQAERCRRLARDSTDAGLSDSLLKLAGGIRRAGRCRGKWRHGGSAGRRGRPGRRMACL